MSLFNWLEMLIEQPLIMHVKIWTLLSVLFTFVSEIVECVESAKINIQHDVNINLI